MALFASWSPGIAFTPAERPGGGLQQVGTVSQGRRPALLPLLLFIVPPFHTIVWLQREMRAGRVDAVRGLLTKRQDGIVPPGMWYVSTRFLTGFLFAAGVLKVVGTNYMLDGLKAGPYANLFSVSAYISTGLWFAIGIVSLMWYSSCLNELRREAAALEVVLTEKSVLVAPFDVAAGDGYALAMMSVLVALLQTLRTWARSRAALQLEVLALRHQLQVLQRSRHGGCGLRRWTVGSGWCSRVC
jgi:hypothetical protein